MLLLRCCVVVVALLCCCCVVVFICYLLCAVCCCSGHNRLVGNSKTSQDDASEKTYIKTKEATIVHADEILAQKNKVRSAFLVKQTQREAARTHKVDPETHRKYHRNLQPSSL